MGATDTIETTETTKVGADARRRKRRTGEMSRGRAVRASSGGGREGTRGKKRLAGDGSPQQDGEGGTETARQDGDGEGRVGNVFPNREEPI